MKKKINIDRPKVSGEEIMSRMNFNQILSNFPGFVKPPFYKTGWFITTVASVTLLVGITTLFLMTPNSPQTETQTVTELAPPPAHLEEAIIYDEDTPCINPPNKNLDIPTTSYSVTAEDGGVISHLGSKIIIPKYAFTDVNGNTLSGKIEIKYREFHDVADFLVAGIPMTYDSAGMQYTFESAGMVEIYGYQNGKPVNIALDKPIHIELPPKDGSERFNLYELDTTNRKWGYRGKPELVKEIVDESTGQGEQRVIEASDVVVSWTMNPEELELQNEVITTKNELEIATKKVIEHKKTAPEKPSIVQNKDRQFALDVNPNEFPELKSYQDLRFEVDKEDKSFTEEVYNIEWEDVRLKEKEAGKSYYMTLYKGAANRTYLVHPVFEGKNLEIAMNNFKKDFSQYTKELDNRKAEEEELKQKYAKQLVAWEKAQVEIQKRQAEADAQNKYNMELWKAQQKNEQVKNVVARAFNVTQFGTWNCDSPIPKPSGANVSATFANREGEILNLKQINLIEKNKNAIFTYDQAQFKNFKYNPKEENTLVAFVDENKLAIFRANKFDEIEKNKFTFKMEVIDVKSLNKEHIKQLLIP